MTKAEALLDQDGPAAPPRANGELAFTAPWERRVFGVTMALTQTAFSYEDFRQHLIARIGEDPHRAYWASWTAALEDALEQACVVDRSTIDERFDEYERRPHGHDH